MITRIVRMEFRQVHVDEFLVHFNSIKNLIRNFPGVLHLELHRDTKQPNVFYTYSKWNAESDLEVYRKSELFNVTWAQVKLWFGAPPQAFSLREELVVKGA